MFVQGTEKTEIFSMTTREPENTGKWRCDTFLVDGEMYSFPFLFADGMTKKGFVLKTLKNSQNNKIYRALGDRHSVRIPEFFFVPCEVPLTELAGTGLFEMKTVSVFYEDTVPNIVSPCIESIMVIARQNVLEPRLSILKKRDGDLLISLTDMSGARFNITGWDEEKKMFQVDCCVPQEYPGEKIVSYSDLWSPEDLLYTIVSHGNHRLMDSKRKRNEVILDGSITRKDSKELKYMSNTIAAAEYITGKILSSEGDMKRFWGNLPRDMISGTKARNSLVAEIIIELKKSYMKKNEMLPYTRRDKSKSLRTAAWIDTFPTESEYLKKMIETGGMKYADWNSEYSPGMSVFSLLRETFPGDAVRAVMELESLDLNNPGNHAVFHNDILSNCYAQIDSISELFHMIFMLETLQRNIAGGRLPGLDVVFGNMGVEIIDYTFYSFIGNKRNYRNYWNLVEIMDSTKGRETQFIFAGFPCDTSFPYDIEDKEAEIRNLFISFVLNSIFSYFESLAENLSNPNAGSSAEWIMSLCSRMRRNKNIPREHQDKLSESTVSVMVRRHAGERMNAMSGMLPEGENEKGVIFDDFVF